MIAWPAPITLSHERAQLRPLSSDDAPDLAEAAAERGLHRLWYTSVPAPENMAHEITRRLGEQTAGRMLPFAVIDPEIGRAVGMTTYMSIDAANRRVEIGSTWYRPSAQRTGLNTACKLLLLGHAFDDLGCIAVEFRTHRLNRQSRAAIERLGAQLDGMLRNHMQMPNGTLRDTAVYSIIASEWPTIRVNLEAMLDR